MSNDLVYTYPVNLFDLNSTYGLAAREIPNGSSVLDIGCFDGSFAKALAEEKKCNVLGVDINRTSLNLAKKKGVRTKLVDLNNPEQFFSELGKKFDVITMLDVLEHLNYPPKILESLPRVLNKSGKLLLSVPNINHVDVIIKIITDGWQTYKDGLLDRTHVHFYSSTELARECSNHGLYVQKEMHVRVPAGMTNVVNDHAKHMEVYEYISKLLDPAEATTFQKLFVLGTTKSSQTVSKPNHLMKPSAYIFQRLGVFARMMFYDLKSRF